MELKIEEVKSRRDLKRFVMFPFKLYKGDPYWVPPLIGGEMAELDRRKNPAFEHTETICFLARKDGRVAGRIAGIINHRYNELWKQKTARFYWFDFIDDPQVSGALLQEVESWAVARGMEEIWGPMGCTTFERQGLVVEGFDRIPTIVSSYNYSYYPEHLEKNGYGKECDYLEYFIHTPEKVPGKIAALADIVAQRYRLRKLEVRSEKHLKTYSRQAFDVVNAAYSPLHGFVPLSERQIAYFLKKYNPLMRRKYFYAAMDENDRMVGFLAAIPSLSKAFRKAGGRLLPFGIFHLLRAIRKPEKLDILLIGLIPEYQNKGVNTFFMRDLTRTCIEGKLPGAETNGMLEDNFRVLNYSRYYETILLKRRRIYKKLLKPAGRKGA